MVVNFTTNMAIIELGGGAGTPPVGSTPLIVLPEVTPSPGVLVGTDGIVQVSDPIPLPEQVPTDGIILLETPSTPNYSGVNRLIELIDVDKVRGNNDVLHYDSNTQKYYHGDIHALIDFPVDSVFGRIGDVVGEYADYAAALVTFAPSFPMISTNVQDAIDEVALTYAKSFLELDDTPSDYTGQAGRYATVNGGETGLEFTFVATVNYDPGTDTYYLPPTTDGQVQNLGQEVFINVIDETLTPVPASTPKVYMVVGTHIPDPDFLKVSRPRAGDLRKGIPFGLNTTAVSGVTGKFKLVTYGYVKSVDTSAWTVGDLLWVDPVSFGEMTNVEPVDNPFAIGIVAVEGNSDGVIFVSTIYPIGVSELNLAGIVHQNQWFTGDAASGAATFYAVKLEDKGTVGSVQLSVIVDDNQTLPLPSDFLSDAFPLPQRFFAGTYNGRVEVEVDDGRANEIITVEIYLADSAGVVTDSGILSEPVGDLGVRPLAVLKSDIRNMSSVQRYNINVSGTLREEIIIPATTRFRAHILCTKLGTEGPAKTFDVYVGNLHNTFVRVPPIKVLNDNADVNITSLSLNDVLTFNGTYWEAAPGGAIAADVSYDNSGSGLAATNVQDAIDEVDVAVDLNTLKISADGSIDTHSDVDTSTVAPNLSEVLTWNGGEWVPGPNSVISIGSIGKIPFSDGASNFSYSTGLIYDSSILKVSNIYVAALIAPTTPLLVLSDLVTGQLIKDNKLYYDGTTLTALNSNLVVTLDISAGTFTGGSLQLTTGATVDTIETTLTDDDTHLPTSGAVFDALPTQVLFGLAGEIPIMNSGPNNFFYTSGFTWVGGLLTVSNIDASDVDTDTFIANTSAQIMQLFLATGAKVVHIEDTALTGAADALVNDDVITAAIAASVITDYVTVTTNQTVTGEKTFSAHGEFSLTLDVGANSRPVTTDHDLFVGNSLQVGTAFNYATGTSRTDLTVGHLTGQSRFLFGQSNGTYGGLIWAYNATPANATLQMYVNGAGTMLEFNQTGQIFAPTLGSDDTEDHFLGIDDSTGLLTKRSVASLGLASYGTTTQVPYMNPGGDDFLYSAAFLFNGTNIITTGSINATGGLVIDGSTTIIKDGSNNLEFTDGVTGTKTLAELSQLLSLGTVGQMPYMNAGGTDFSYSPSLHYTTGVFNAPNINVSAIAASSIAQLVTTAVATGALGTSTDLTWDGTTLDIGTGKKGAVESLLFKQGSAIVGVLEGLVWWNDNEYTLNIDTGLGPVLQVGQEIFLLIYNDTGGQLDNLTVLRPKAGFLVGSLILPTVQKTDASVWIGVEGTIMVATMDIPDGEVGLATRFGRARGGDGSGGSVGETWLLGDQLYVSETPGELTNVRPEFPSYNISVGGVVDNSTAPDGEVFVSLTRSFNDTFDNFHNGTIRESFSFVVTEAGGVITGHLDDQEGNDWLTYLFEDGFHLVDTSSTIDIILTAGDDDDPITNYVYILESTKALTLSTVGFPIVEHIKVAQIVLQSATTTGTDGPLRNQNFNDHLQDTAGQGHLAHIGAKLRRFDSQWDTGTEGVVTVDTGPTPDDVWLTVTSGSIFQMHPQPFDAFDLEVSGHIHVVNHDTTPYVAISNLNTQLDTALGVSMNNTSFSFVVWGVVNSAGEPSQLMMNLPVDTYSFNTPDTAVQDPANYAVYTIPSIFQGVGFLIARFTFTYKNDLWVLYDTEDLRGKLPNTSAGGGAGGTGVTTFLALTDTPASYIGAALQIPQVNAGVTALEFTDSPTVATLYFNDTNTYIDESASELQFTDTVNGSVLLSSLISSLTVGTVGQIPYVNAGGTDFDYSSSLHYTTGVLNVVGGITVSSLAAASTAQPILSTVATGAFATSINFTFSGTLLSVTGGVTVSALTTTGSFKFTGGQQVDTIELSLTNDDTHLPTSGAVFDALAALPPGISFGAQYQIPYVNSTTDDFDYVSALRYEMGVLYAANVTIPALAAATQPEVVTSAVATGALATSGNLTFSGSLLTVTGDLTVTVDAILGSLKLSSSAAIIDAIQTTITDLDSALPTSGAVVDYVAAQAYTHPNHSGQVDSVGDGAQSLNSTAITAQGPKASVVGSENLLMEDSGTLYEIALGQLDNYLNANLNFNDYTHPNHTGQVTSTGDGGQVAQASIITSQTPGGAISGTDTWLRQSSGILTEATVTQIETYMQANLSFSTQTLALGLSGEVPYMNGGGTDFLYTAAVGYFSGAFTVPTLKVSGLSTSGRVIYTAASGQLTTNANMEFDGTELEVNTLSLSAGTGVDTIETTLTNDADHIAASSAIFAAIGAVATQWTTDANGITYAGNIGVGLASNATVKFYVQPDAGDVAIAMFNNYAYSAWVDYPTSLPNRTLVISRTPGNEGLNDYTAISLQCTAGVGKNNYCVLAVQGTSATTQQARFNIMLRGGGTTDYENVLSIDYDSTYWFRNNGGDLSLMLREAGTTKYIFGFDDALDAFILAAGGAYPTGVGRTLSASRFKMTNAGKVFFETNDNTAYSATAVNTANLYIYNTSVSNVTTNFAQLQLRVYNAATSWLPIVQLSCRQLTTASHDSVFTVGLRANNTGTYYEAFAAQSDGIFYMRSEGTAEDIRIRLAQQAGGIVCTYGWDDSTSAFVVDIGTGGTLGTAPYYQFDTNIFTMWGSTSATFTLDALTSTALIYLQSASSQDSRIHFRYNGSTNVVVGWDAGLSIFQIHTSSSFTTLASGDFSITSTGDIYMGTLASATGTYYMRYNTTSGQVSYTTSDIRNKKDIKPFEVDALDALMRFDPKSFTWKADNKKAIGWIAQEGMEVIPDMFPFIEKIDRYGMDEFNILPYYHRAIQQLKAEIDDLRAQLNNN